MEKSPFRDAPGQAPGIPYCRTKRKAWGESVSRLCFSARTGPLIAVCASPSPAERLLSHYGVRYQVGLERHVVCGDSLHSEAVEKVLPVNRVERSFDSKKAFDPVI